MKYRFVDDHGTFELPEAEKNTALYFPLCNEAGLMGSVTPTLGGDLMTDQNHFVLQPTSVFDLQNNKNQRNFWLRFNDGALRSATGNSVWQRAEIAEGKNPGTKVRGGLLWHEAENSIEYKGNSIFSKILSFMPSDNTKAEVMCVTLVNTGKDAVEFTPVSVVGLYGRSATNLRDHRHVTSLLHRISTESYGVRVKPVLSFDERGHLVNTTEYFSIGCDDLGNRPVGFFPTADAVTGEGGDMECPFGMKECVPAGFKAEGTEAAGGIEFEKCILPAGKEKTYIIFTGAREEGDDYNSPENIIKRFGSAEKINAALAENKKFWLKKAGIKGNIDLENIPKESSEKERFMLWVSVEPVMRRIFGCSFLPYHDYGKGGRGWRDLWQDCLALMLDDPKDVRDLLINNFAGVRADGTNATIIGSKPGEFIADRNGIARVWMDHGVWPWITMDLYIELSGDLSVLDVEQGYFKDVLCKRAHGKDEGDDYGNRLCDASGKEYRGSLLEHILLMHVTAACDTGEHGFMLLRGADWNDALDMANVKGESVAFTAAYAGNFRTLSDTLKKKGGTFEIMEELNDLLHALHDICKTGKDSSEKRKALDVFCEKVKHTVSGKTVTVNAEDTADMLSDISDSICDNIRRSELMEDAGYAWINGYYDNNGERLEDLSKAHLMLTSAVFTIMSHVADDDTVRKIIKTADKYLFTENGGYRLNTRFDNESEHARSMGRMFGFAYGSKENGAVFSHMAVMYAYALLGRGFTAEADKVIDCLIRQSLDFEKSHVYPGIPEYFDINGRGMYPYLTGAASWMLLYRYRRDKIR